MAGTIYEALVLHFIIFTILIGGTAAFYTGRAVAQNWQPAWYVVFYAVLLSASIRFLYFAVLQHSLLSMQYFTVDFCVLAIAGYLGWRLKRNSQMKAQYGWLYEARKP